MVSACIEIETTRDIARQILRHRSFSFQEFSQRYADPTQSLAFEIEKHDCKILTIGKTVLHLILRWMDMLYFKANGKTSNSDVIDASLDAYNWAISKGIAKEQARAVLPEGNTVSRCMLMVH